MPEPREPRAPERARGGCVLTRRPLDELPIGRVRLDVCPRACVGREDVVQDDLECSPIEQDVMECPDHPEARILDPEEGHPHRRGAREVDAGVAV